MQCTLVCVVVVVGVCVSSGEAGRGQVGPGPRPGQPARSQMAAGSSGISPTTQTPETTLPFGGKWRRWGGQGLILQGGKCRGSREAGVPQPGSLRWQKGPWSQPCPPRGRGLARHPPSAAEGPAPLTRLCPRTAPCSLPPQAVGEGFCQVSGHPPAPPVLYHTTPHEMR